MAGIRGAAGRWRMADGKKKLLRPAHVLAGLTLLFVPVAFAMPRFRLQAIEQFHYDQGNPLWQLDRRVMACTYCHVNTSGGAPWNPFGHALQVQFVADAAAGQRNKFPQVLFDLLRAQRDSDGDGYADALEVFARTLPGDMNSRPEQPLDELEAAFAAAGGIAQYSPVSKP